ncbi:hypothetical protein RDI58_013257 [Solanum bulbocastanum]|uniref:Uncharacterized protein n=1 Tax=Solanum bulbocastanum TaxID=147425 RepID=A0AAN8TQI6_SOLBU
MKKKGPVVSRQLLMARKESWARSSSLREAYSPFPSSQIFWDRARAPHSRDGLFYIIRIGYSLFFL